MAVIFSVEAALRVKSVKLKYYQCMFFTFDEDTRTLFVPSSASQIAILSVLTKI